MRVTDVELSYGQVNFMTVAVQGASTNDRYLVKAMIGLDADQIVSKFYGFSKTSKTRQYSMSLPQREIVLRVVLNPDYGNNETVEEIRDRLYRIISADRTGLLTMVFRSGGASIAKISGFLTKFEVPHFSKEPELQITMRCEDPIFRSVSLNEITTNLPAVEDFVLTDTVSNAPHGFEMMLTANALTPNFTMQDREVDPEWQFLVVPDAAFDTGDTLRISSVFSEKTVEHTPSGGSATPIVNNVATDSFWPVMFPGSNDMWIDGLGTTWTLNYIQYYSAFWGV